MIQVNELRLGNLVYDNKNYIRTIVLISSDRVELDNGMSYFINLNPILLNSIPLTEEWLLKFGFEKIVYDSEETGYGIDYHLICNGDIFMCYSDDFSLALFASESSKDDDLGVLPIWSNSKTVHGFQNIYFALTGEELKIN